MRSKAHAAAQPAPSEPWCGVSHCRPRRSPAKATCLLILQRTAQVAGANPGLRWRQRRAAGRRPRPARFSCGCWISHHTYAATTDVRALARERGFFRTTISTSRPSAFRNAIRGSTEKPSSLSCFSAETLGWVSAPPDAARRPCHQKSKETDPNTVRGVPSEMRRLLPTAGKYSSSKMFFTATWRRMVPSSLMRPGAGSVYQSDASTSV